MTLLACTLDRRLPAAQAASTAAVTAPTSPAILTVTIPCPEGSNPNHSTFAVFTAASAASQAAANPTTSINPSASPRTDYLPPASGPIGLISWFICAVQPAPP